VQKSNLNCKICGSRSSLSNILSLNKVPPSAQGFTKNKRKNYISLNILQCQSCGLVQSNNKPVKYFKETIRAAGFSKSMVKFRNKQFKSFINKFNLKYKSIVEIGAGNGDYLSILKKYSKKSVGIENSKSNVSICKKKKLNVYRGYVADKKFKVPKGPYDGFICMSFMEHSPNVNNFLKGIIRNLNSEAYGIIEVPNFDMILKKKLYTEFIIDHLNYFTKQSLIQTLNINGFEIIKINSIWDGYILSAIVKKRGIPQKLILENVINKIKKDFIKFKKKVKKKNIAIWGAGHQALTVISLAKINYKIKCIIDSANFKQNKYSPGDKIKVIAPSEISNEKIDGIIIMAAGYSDEVYKFLKLKKFKGQIAILRHDHFEFK
tara:strand:+ start:1632 stop:2762 length:1131 start_codon:yes stop_codon:yes gene_type:complete